MRKNISLFVLIVVSIILFILSCQTSGGGGGVKPITTLSAEVKVQDIYPISGTERISLLQPMRIKFTHWLYELPEGGTISLNGRDIDNEYIDIVADTITIKPNPKWDKNANYSRISIRGFKTVFYDELNRDKYNEEARVIKEYNDEDYKFTTTDDENKPPSAEFFSISPNNGSRDVDLNSKLKIGFSLDLDSNLKGKIKLGDIEFSNSDILIKGSAIEVDADKYLEYSKTYNGIEVYGFKTDSSSGSLDVVYYNPSYSFTTKDDPKKPTPPSTNPVEITTTTLLAPAPTGSIYLTRVLMEGLGSAWQDQKLILAGVGLGGFPPDNGIDWTYDKAPVKGTVNDIGTFEYTFPTKLTVDDNFNFTGVRLDGSGKPVWESGKIEGLNFDDGKGNQNVGITNPKNTKTYYLYCGILGSSTWEWYLREEEGNPSTTVTTNPSTTVTTNPSTTVTTNPSTTVSTSGPVVTYNPTPVTIPERVGDKGRYESNLISYTGPQIAPIPLTNIDWRDQVIYFMMVDKFFDGDTSNNPVNHMSVNAPQIDKRLEPNDVRMYHGGDLQGIMDKVGYLKELGVTAIWLSPIVQNMLTDDHFGCHHGYHAIDMNALDDRYAPGSMASNPGAKYEFFKKFVNFMHANGILVVQDIVVNHMGNIRKNATKNAPDGNWAWGYPWKGGGKYYGMFLEDMYDKGEKIGGELIGDWLFRDKRLKPPFPFDQDYFYHDMGNMQEMEPWREKEPATKGDLVGLPDLATDDPRVKQVLIETYQKWVKAGIDGFRVDTVKHVEEEFFDDFAPAMRDAARSIGTNHFLQYGEFWERGNYSNMTYYVNRPKGLDSLLDFPMWEKIYASFRYDSGPGDIAGMVGQRNGVYRNYGIPGGANLSALEGMITFLDNHDVERFMTYIQGEDHKLRSALMFLLTQQGIPCIYYNTENNIARFGHGDDWKHRIPMPDFVTTGKPTFKVIKELNAIRKGNEALRRGNMNIHSTDNNMLVFTRDFNNQRTVVAISMGGASGNANIPSGSYSSTIVANDGTVTTGSASGSSVNVPARGCVILKRN